MTDRPPGNPPPTGFTPEELARLVAYKAAVAAGFYDDWPAGLGNLALQPGPARSWSKPAGGAR
jgi:hypothetical protein